MGKNDIGFIKYTGDFMDKAKEAREPSPSKTSDGWEVHITVISVLSDGTQMVAHGIKGFVAARAHIKQRVATQKYPGATTRYTRFIVIGSREGVDGIHIYDSRGLAIKELFV